MQEFFALFLKEKGRDFLYVCKALERDVTEMEGTGGSCPTTGSELYGKRAWV